MKVAIALALVGILITGCSDSSTESAASNDTGSSSGSDQSNNDQSDGNTSSGSNSDSSGDQTSGDNDSGDSADNGNTGSGSTGSGDTDSGGSTDDDSDDNTAGVACTSTDVGIAFQGINATVVSDPDAAPSELIDGCVDRAHSWSGDYGSIVTLDAGAVHQMQGVYIWSTFARMEWIKIESSADGLNWSTDWKSVPTKPVNGPVYYGLDEVGSARYVRVTGFGSDLNDWTNIAEVRWSLSGYNVTGERVYISRNSDQDTGVTVATYSLENSSLAVIDSVAGAISYTVATCGEFPIQIWDVTGEMSKFFTVAKISGVENYLVDFDYVGEDDSTDFTPPSSFFSLSDQYWEDHGRPFYEAEAQGPYQNRTCRVQDADEWYSPAAIWRDYLRGTIPLYTVQPNGFR